MTPLEKMQTLETILQALFQKLQWSGDPESIRLLDEAMQRLTELQEQERLLSEIF